MTGTGRGLDAREWREEQEPFTSGAPLGESVGWMPRRVLVASNGSAASGSALAVARRIAARAHARVEIVAVFTPRIPRPPAEPFGRGGRIRFEDVDRGDVLDLVRRVRRQRTQNGVGRGTGASAVRLEIGEPAQSIYEYASRSGADLVVTGLGREDPAHRRTGGGVAQRLAALIDRPFLAVAAGASTEPRSALVLLEGDPRADAPLLATVRAVVRQGGEIRRMWTDDLPEPTHVHLLALANELGVDLVAARIRGEDATVRRLVPNVVASLLAESRRSVLGVGS